MGAEENMSEVNDSPEHSQSVVGDVPESPPPGEGGTEDVVPEPTTEVEASEPEVVADIDTDTPLEFNWEDWDGTVDNLLEADRELGGRIVGYFEARLEKLREENADLQKWSDLFKDDDIDPALAELQKQLTTVEERLAAVSGERDDFQTKYKDLEAAVEAEVEAETQRLQAEFEKEHGDLLKDDAAREVLAGLIDLGSDPDTAARALKMSPAAAEAFIDAKADGAPDAVAMKFAKLKAGMPAPKPEVSPAARLIGGSRSTQRPAPIIEAPEEATTIEGSRMNAIRRAFKKHNIRS